jgi:exosome complex component RRP4
MSEQSDRQFVVPGELIGEKLNADGSIFREDGKVISTVKGLSRNTKGGVSVIPLNGVYKPKAGDMVLGVVEHDFGGIYALDISSPYRCILRPRSPGMGAGDRRGPRNKRDMGRENRYGRNQRDSMPEPESYKIGDLVSAKISSVDEVYEAQLTGPRILEGGYVISVKPARVPRIIGKKKSMIEIIRNYTGSRISVGQNGLIWIKEGNLPLAIRALRMVEENAYKSGLTDRIGEFLRTETRG